MARGWSASARHLWGTESAWRIPLNELFDAKVIVFWEHVLILLMFLPILLPQLGELRKIDRRTWGFLIFSGFAGSAVGTIFFTLALKHGNPTVVNVILNIQPVISTLGAVLIFGDKLAPRFFLYAAIAIFAGMFLSVEHPELIGVSFAKGWPNDRDWLRTDLRVFLGRIDRGRPRRHARHVSPARFQHAHRCRSRLHDRHFARLRQTQWRCALAGAAQAHPGRAVGALILLASISGGIPLLIYFEGLRLTRASTAGYFEMMQTLAAVCITWGFFHAALRPHQIVAALILIAAVTMVQQVQAKMETSPSQR